MYFRCLHFVLLGFFLEALNVSGHRETGDCLAPVLEGVFFVPVGQHQHIGRKETYPHGATINYSCEEGRKPNTKGWWATSTCQNGIWTQTPQCIDENDCRGPEIPHAQYTSPPYKNGKEITIECDHDEGYRISGTATTTCRNGTWTSPSPICKRDINACTQPDEILNAVIMHDYQTIFPDQKRILYKCEKGYSVAQGKKNAIVCSHGQWSDAECVIDPTPPAPTQPAATVPVPGDRAAPVPARPAVPGDPVTGVSTQPAGTEPMLVSVERCGDIPTITHAVVTPGRMSLTYQCVNHYKLVGNAHVVCYGDGHWSSSPTCREAFCRFDTAKYLLDRNNPYLKEGESKWVYCKQVDYNGYSYQAYVKCDENGLGLQTIRHTAGSGYQC